MLNGTIEATAGAVFDFDLCEFTNLGAGSYSLSGCPAGGDTYTYRLFIIHYKANGTVEYRNDKGAGATFTIDNGDKIRLTVRIGKDLGTVDNLTFYPQLERGTAATEYESYKDPALYQQAMEKAGQIKTALVELGGSPIFNRYGFGESILNEIITKQADILAKQDSYIGTASEVSISASGSNINDILDNVINVQELILTAQNNYIGGDSE